MKKLFSFFALTLLSLGLFAQDIENIDLISSDDKILVTYDLFGKKSETYSVALLFKTPDGNEIRPKNLSGDVGKEVKPGKGKTIVWDVYKDIDKLQGDIEPILKAVPSDKNTVAHTSTDIKPKSKKEFKRVVAGWKIGTGRSSVITNENANLYEKRKAWQGGFYSRFNIAKGFYFQPELLYAKQAYRWETNGNNDYVDINNHYLRGQALIGISPFGGGVYLTGGAYYSYLFNSKGKQYNNNDLTELDLLNQPEINGETSWFATEDYGWTLGGTLSGRQGKFALGVLYHQGIPNINNNTYWTGDMAVQAPELNNKGVTFFAQFGF